jgi:short-subunit dehydrogenase involved in D-alanine esterification of teichoic acids
MPKVILINEGTNEIGKEIVSQLLKEGNKVISASNNADEVASLHKDLFENYGERRYKITQCDVTNENEVSELLNLVIERYGPVEILVNNLLDSSINIQNILQLVTANTLEVMRQVGSGLIINLLPCSQESQLEDYLNTLAKEAKKLEVNLSNIYCGQFMQDNGNAKGLNIYDVVNIVSFLVSQNQSCEINSMKVNCN